MTEIHPEAPHDPVQPREEASTAAPAARQYPINPAPDDDPRFTRGLALDVAKALQEHGYPEISNGLDFVDLQQALYRFLYVPDTARE